MEILLWKICKIGSILKFFKETGLFEKILLVKNNGENTGILVKKLMGKTLGKKKQMTNSYNH